MGDPHNHRSKKPIAQIPPQFGLTAGFDSLPEKANDSSSGRRPARGRSDEAVRDLVATMEDAQWRAMSRYAKLLRARDASGS
jgi:hypothetical protein